MLNKLCNIFLCSFSFQSFSFQKLYDWTLIYYINLVTLTKGLIYFKVIYFSNTKLDHRFKKISISFILSCFFFQTSLTSCSNSKLRLAKIEILNCFQLAPLSRIQNAGLNFSLHFYCLNNLKVIFNICMYVYQMYIWY